MYRLVITIFLLLLFHNNNHAQECYTIPESNGGPISPDCSDIDFVYNTINSVHIMPTFHFIEFKGFQFECGATDPRHDATIITSYLIDSINYILGNFAVNTNGGSQLPNNGESKIRFFDTPDVFECSNMHFWSNLNEYENATAGNNDFNIVFKAKYKLKLDSLTMTYDTTYDNQSGVQDGHGFHLHNVHHAIFFNNESIDFITDEYDGLSVHELFHVFNLEHSWLCIDPCADLDDVVECGGTPPNGNPCGSACESLAPDGVYGNSNNTMGYNPKQDALSNCQYARAFSGIIDPKPWKAIEFNDEYECEDIIIDQSYNFTTTWECDKVLNCNLEILSGRELIFDNIRVEMGAGTSIIIHPGSRLIIKGGDLVGKENVKGFWEGIKILKGDNSPQYDDPYYDIQNYSLTKPGTLVVERRENSNTALIKNADIGILVGEGIAKYPGGGLVYIDRARIENCNVGIKFNPFNHYNKSSIHIFSMFTNTQDIVIKSNYGFTFENLLFHNNQDIESYGIILHNSSIDNLLSPNISNRNIGITVLGTHPSLDGFNIGKRAPLTGVQSSISNCDVGIALSSYGFGAIDNMNVYDVKLQNTELGIMTIGECEYNVFDNQFNYNNDSTSVFMLGLSSGNATNDCYCNSVTNTSTIPGSIGFGFVGNNKNTTLFGNEFSFSTKSDDCIRTEGNGDIFITQATFFDPIVNPISDNLPAGNDFKDVDNDLLIDFNGNEIRYLVPNDNSLNSFFPDYNSNYFETQSSFNPLQCITMLGAVHEPDTLIVGDEMPLSVKNEWPNLIIGAENQEDYIKYINDLPEGTIDSSDLINETARAEYALYNSVISASTSGNFEVLLNQLEGNIWKRILYGYYVEKDEIQLAENVLQTMSLNDPEDYDFVFVQEIVIDKLQHEINEIQVPFTISNIDKQNIETIINKESIISGYASALYFDIYGEVLVPSYSGSSGSIPRRNTEKINSTFVVYPNPSSSILYIEGLDFDEKVEVLDIYLNKLVTFKYKSKEALDISNLKNGIYFIKSSKHGSIRFIKI